MRRYQATRLRIARQLWLVALTLSLSGCAVVLPGESPLRSLQQDGKPVAFDQRDLCGPADSKHLIRIGMERDHVRFLLRNNEDEPKDGKRLSVRGDTDVYSFINQGKALWCGPNPEGGLFGVSKVARYYHLSLIYDEVNRLRSYQLTKADSVDSHGN